MEEVKRKHRARNFLKELGEEGIKEFLENVLKFKSEEIIVFDKKEGFAIAQYTYKEDSTERNVEKFVESKISEFIPSFGYMKAKGYEFFKHAMCLTNYTAQDMVKEKNYTAEYVEFMRNKFGKGYVIGNNKSYFSQQRKKSNELEKE